MRSWKVRVGVLSILLAGAALLTGCGDRARGDQQVGIVRDSATSSPAAVIYACSGEHVEKVELWLLNKNGGDRERKLWGLVRVPGTTGAVGRILLGRPAGGLVEDVPLAGDIPSDRELEFNATVGGFASIEFRLKDLDVDSVLVVPSWFGGRAHVSPHQFNEVNTRECRHAKR
jgi:hypothetical protein